MNNDISVCVLRSVHELRQVWLPDKQRLQRLRVQADANGMIEKLFGPFVLQLNVPNLE